MFSLPYIGVKCSVYWCTYSVYRYSVFTLLASVVQFIGSQSVVFWYKV